MSREDHALYDLVYENSRFELYGAFSLRMQVLQDFLPPALIKPTYGPLWVIEHITFSMDENTYPHSQYEWDTQYTLFLKDMLEEVRLFCKRRYLTELFTCLEASLHEDLVTVGRWPLDWQLGLQNGKILSRVSLEVTPCPSFYGTKGKGWKV